MDYSFHFGQVWPQFDYLLAGAWISLQIAVLSFAGGLLIGTACAAALTFGPMPLRKLIRAYVVFFTNTPQLVQVYFLYFALPDWGILLGSFTAVVIGMTLNAGAYLTEIQRAGFASRRQSEIEAAEVLGLTRLQQIQHVILPHIAQVLFPPLSNHFIIMTLGTSMAAIFGVEELTGRAFNVSAETFRSIEVFSVTALIYVALTLVASAALGLLGRLAFRTSTGRA